MQPQLVNSDSAEYSDHLTSHSFHTHCSATSRSLISLKNYLHSSWISLDLDLQPTYDWIYYSVEPGFWHRDFSLDQYWVSYFLYTNFCSCLAVGYPLILPVPFLRAHSAYTQARAVAYWLWKLGLWWLSHRLCRAETSSLRRWPRPGARPPWTLSHWN